MLKIDKKIIDHNVVKPSAAINDASEMVSNELSLPVDGSDLEQFEDFKRPDVLIGSTYKIKASISTPHALYVTITDLIINRFTDYERIRPYEIFINSKNMDHFQWIVALTRIISAIFRKGGDSSFLVEELKAVFDPRGGYFSNRKYIPSLVAEIGTVIETHLSKIGMLHPESLPQHTQNILNEKRKEFAKRHNLLQDRHDNGEIRDGLLCGECNTLSVILMDGCLTCLNCGDSKCS